MATREQFVATARKHLGVRFQHQGRLPEAGVDCIGLVILVCKELGISDFDITDYGRMPDGRMDEYCRHNLNVLRMGEVRPGDVLTFRWERHSSHMAIVSDVTDAGVYIVHAYLKNRKVVEHRMDNMWLALVSGCYEIRGLE